MGGAWGAQEFVVGGEVMVMVACFWQFKEVDGWLEECGYCPFMIHDVLMIFFAIKSKNKEKKRKQKMD